MTKRGRRTYKPKTAREAALEALIRVDRDGAYSNIALNTVLQEARLESRDAGLATELVYGTIQRKNTIDYFLSRFVKKGLQKLDSWVLQLLRMSFYQLYYLDRIPDHAVVNESVSLAKKRGHQGISGMVNGVLRSVLREKDQLIVPDSLHAGERIALQYSHPEWMVNRWIKQFGEEETTRICEANNFPPASSIRVNTLKFDRDEYVKRLAEHQIPAAASTLSLSGIRLDAGGNPAAHDGFQKGEFTVQDESSMLVAESLCLEPGMTVLDACAAPGGKTTHAAEMMKDEGMIWANDLHPHKEQLIRDQVQRLNLKSIRTSTKDALELPKQFAPETFDRILLDAPCTGFGVIRRKPDIKWQKQPEDIAAISNLQGKLLRTLSPLLKPGGLLVYSTCTIDQEENEHVIEQFLSENDSFRLLPYTEDFFIKRHAFQQVKRELPLTSGMLRIHPNDFGTDGFFIARLQKL